MDYQGTISRGVRAPIIRQGDDLVKITAEEVKPDGTVYISLNFGELDVYRCKGAVTIDAAESLSFMGLWDSFTYAESLDELLNDPYTEWLDLSDGTFTKPGAYLFSSTVSDAFYSPLPAKVQFIFTVEEGSAAPAAPVALAAPVEYELKSFSDVAAGRWSHSAIMEMVDLGLFAGTEKPNANGVGEFDPTGTMTRAQFVTVITRYLYNEELQGLAAGTYWYSNNYDVAVKHGIITNNEFAARDMDQPVTRQEMALMVVRALEAGNVDVSDMADEADIADFADIGSYYRDYVRQALAMGLITGYDDQGTFGPNDTLTREQGAMVIYRLVNEDARVSADGKLSGLAILPPGIPVE